MIKLKSKCDATWRAFVAFLFIFIASNSMKPIKDSSEVSWNWWKHLMFCYDTNERERERERELMFFDESI